MAEYIDRDAAISIADEAWTKSGSAIAALIWDRLHDLSVEPVVRCKDCKYNNGGYCHNDDGFAHFDHFVVQDDDYCSRGEMDGKEELVYCAKCKYNNGKSCEWYGTPIVVDGWCSHGRTRMDGE